MVELLREEVEFAIQQKIDKQYYGARTKDVTAVSGRSMILAFALDSNLNAPDFLGLTKRYPEYIEGKGESWVLSKSVTGSRKEELLERLGATKDLPPWAQLPTKLVLYETH